MRRRDTPSVTALSRRATSPVPLRFTGQEKLVGFSLLPRNAGEVALGAQRRVTEGASGRSDA